MVNNGSGVSAVARKVCRNETFACSEARLARAEAQRKGRTCAPRGTVPGGAGRPRRSGAQAALLPMERPGRAARLAGEAGRIGCSISAAICEDGTGRLYT